MTLGHKTVLLIHKTQHNQLVRVARVNCNRSFLNDVVLCEEVHEPDSAQYLTRGEAEQSTTISAGEGKM